MSVMNSDERMKALQKLAERMNVSEEELMKIKMFAKHFEGITYETVEEN